MGRVALVTGGSRGIGEAISKALKNEGYAVAATYAGNDEKAAAFTEATGIKTYKWNAADYEASKAGIAQVESDLGPIDTVVANAGITRDNLFMRMSDEEWQSVLNVNLTATMKLCKGVMRGMMKARWGRIVNISSVVGATGNPGQANYAASKAGVVGMSKSLAYEVASRGITVNCVAPGFITTAMTDKLTDDQKAAILTNVPAGRMGDADEIGAAVLYLASAEAGYVTGATLHVNGGMAMF